MFRLMLGHHSQIAWAHEFEAAVAFLGDSGWLTLDQYRACLSTHRAFLSEAFEIDSSLEYPDLVRDFLRQAHERDGRKQIAFVIHSRFHRCPDIWPEARYIHVIRDPRDVANSCRHQGWAGNAYYGVRYWTEAEERWNRLVARTRDDQRFEVRYEELVRDPERVLHGVCEFLRLNYEEGMLEYARDTTYERPDPSLIFQWRRTLSERDVVRVESRCHKLLEERGYEPSGLPIEKLRLLERGYMLLDHEIRRAMHRIRRYGPGLWTLHVLARFLGTADLRKSVQLRRNAIDRKYLK
jgi:hypothetical protein